MDIPESPIYSELADLLDTMPQVDLSSLCEQVVAAVEEVRVTSETGGQKGSKLARFDLIDPGVWTEVAEHYGKGALKYDDDNWRRGYDWKLSYAACQRHLNAFWAGEDYDPETGSKHVVAALWHCIALAWFMDNMRQYDSRCDAAEIG